MGCCATKDGTREEDADFTDLSTKKGAESKGKGGKPANKKASKYESKYGTDAPAVARAPAVATVVPPAAESPASPRDPATPTDRTPVGVNKPFAKRDNNIIANAPEYAEKQPSPEGGEQSSKEKEDSPAPVPVPPVPAPAPATEETVIVPPTATEAPHNDGAADHPAEDAAATTDEQPPAAAAGDWDKIVDDAVPDVVRDMEELARERDAHAAPQPAAAVPVPEEVAPSRPAVVRGVLQEDEEEKRVRAEMREAGTVEGPRVVDFDIPAMDEEVVAEPDEEEAVMAFEPSFSPEKGEEVLLAAGARPAGTPTTMSPPQRSPVSASSPVSRDPPSDEWFNSRGIEAPEVLWWQSRGDVTVQFKPANNDATWDLDGEKLTYSCDADGRTYRVELWLYLDVVGLQGNISGDTVVVTLKKRDEAEWGQLIKGTRAEMFKLNWLQRSMMRSTFDDEEEEEEEEEGDLR